jgi:hypothetical protein
MKTRIQGLFTFVLVFLCAPQVTLAQELNQTFTTLEGFSMKLPVDWVRIESQLLDNSSKALGLKQAHWGSGGATRGKFSDFRA